MQNKEIILNGMNKEQLKEGRTAAALLLDGYDMLINQLERIESGEVVAQSEIRAAKLKLTESFYIMKDLEVAQNVNAKHYSNPNRDIRRSKKNGKR